MIVCRCRCVKRSRNLRFLKKQFNNFEDFFSFTMNVCDLHAYAVSLFVPISVPK